MTRGGKPARIFITKAGKPLPDAQLQLFLYPEGKIVKYPKIWISIDDQIELLMKDKLAKGYLIAQKSEQYIKHFASKYGDERDLPSYWMMAECATMGTLELLCQKAPPKTRAAVASKLGAKAPVFRNWLSVLRVTRNACCHHSRIWNREWGVCPKIPNAWNWSETANNKTFAVLSMIYYLLGKTGDAAEPWRAEFEELLEEFQDIDPRRIGAPERWQDAVPWSRSE